MGPKGEEFFQKQVAEVRANVSKSAEEDDEPGDLKERIQTITSLRSSLAGKTGWYNQQLVEEFDSQIESMSANESIMISARAPLCVFPRSSIGLLPAAV